MLTPSVESSSVMADNLSDSLYFRRSTPAMVTGELLLQAAAASAGKRSGNCEISTYGLLKSSVKTLSHWSEFSLSPQILIFPPRKFASSKKAAYERSPSAR